MRLSLFGWRWCWTWLTFCHRRDHQWRAVDVVGLEDVGRQGCVMIKFCNRCSLPLEVGTTVTWNKCSKVDQNG